MVEVVPTMRDTLAGRIGGRLAVSLLAALGPTRSARLAASQESGETAALVASEIGARTPEGLRDAMAAAAAYDGRPHLASLSIPTLVVVGEDNRKTHGRAEAMARAMPNARFLRLPGGHVLPYDNPEGLTQAIHAFLADQPSL